MIGEAEKQVYFSSLAGHHLTFSDRTYLLAFIKNLFQLFKALLTFLIKAHYAL